MSITENIMIELRQMAADAHDSGGQKLNGEYDITLPERVTIEENDVVSIESVFIDDEGENMGKIEIETAIEGYIAFNMYLVDCNPSQHFRSATDGGAVGLDTFRTYSDVLTNHPDGKKYYLSSLDDAAQTGRERRIKSLTFDTHTKLDAGKEVMITLIFTLVNIQGQVTTHALYLKPEFLSKHQPIPNGDGKYRYTLDQDVLNKAIDNDNPATKSNFQFPFVIQDSNVQPVMIISSKPGQPTTYPVYPQDKRTDAIERDTIKYGDSEPMETSHHISVRENQVYFRLEAGKYDPDDIARRISDQITSPYNKQVAGAAVTRGDIPAGEFTESQAFITSKKLHANGLDYNGSVANTSPLWVREDGAKFARMTDDFTNTNQWCGASNFGLSYNGIDRFEFTNLHNSQYSGGTATSAGVKIVRGANVANNVTQPQFLVNAHSGLSISTLFPSSLWVDKLGFTQRVAYVNPVYSSNTGIQFTLQNPTRVINPSVETMTHLIEGINFTGDLASTDTLTFKSDVKDATHGYAYDLVGDSIAGVSTAIVNTYPVVGDSIQQGAKQENGYYLIEVDAGFPSKMIGHDKNNNKVQAIVGRFYSGTTYTQSTGGEGAIVYQHKGSPIQLSNLKCRITLPDGELATLGSDNTIFLKVTKGK